MSETDLELLARYSRQNAEDAFSEIVRRHLDLVYSAALRQVRSPQLAEEVAQSTFLKLAHHTRELPPHTIVTAWLYQVTRREAIDVVRREARRQLREQTACEMNVMNANASDWIQIEPLLDEAMDSLDDRRCGTKTRQPRCGTAAGDSFKTRRYGWRDCRNNRSFHSRCSSSAGQTGDDNQCQHRCRGHLGNNHNFDSHQNYRYDHTAKSVSYYRRCPRPYHNHGSRYSLARSSSNVGASHIATTLFSENAPGRVPASVLEIRRLCRS